MKYQLKLRFRENNEISTFLTNLETGETCEEQWELTEGVWIFKDGWGELPGLYSIIKEDDAFCDHLLNQLAADFYGVIEFNA